MVSAYTPHFRHFYTFTSLDQAARLLSGQTYLKRIAKGLQEVTYSS
ncbi:hypothetical protein S7335_4922 [Synechococcus sp. PCC 7335]|nr:hypothetical protein S7335_4922 [Synechococcus sp. PCC 7335]